MTSSIKQLFTETKKLCEPHLESYFLNQQSLSPQLKKACQYSLFAGGKRVRPAFSVALSKDIENDNFDLILPIASSLECIHTYSLIHDDLPAMDDDDLRRGKATCHIAFDEATAILAGDALLNAAFEILSSSSWNIDSEKKVPIIAYIAKKSGACGMVGGQMLDLIHEKNSALDRETLERIHQGKTAALINAALIAPAIALGLDETIRAKLNTIANNIGLAFQVADDILDVTQSSKTLGKNANSDVQQEKSTYVSILGLEEAQNTMQKLFERVISDIKSLNLKHDNLEQLARFIIERQS